jgi:N-acetylmuramoyl-L-alanine amidase
LIFVEILTLFRVLFRLMARHFGWSETRALRSFFLLTLLAGFALFSAGVANASGKTLRDLRIESPTATEAMRVVIEVETDTVPKFFVLERPLRAVVDLPATRKPPALRMPAAQGAVRTVRAGPQADGSLRLVLDLAADARVSWSGGDAAARRFVLEVARGASSPAAAPAVATASTGTTASTGATAPVASSPAQSVVALATSAPAPEASIKPIKAEHSPVGGRDVIVAVDAGHGGQDPGAIGRAGTREKDVVLDISKELAERINREPGMRAILTRDGDYFLTLRQRIRRAREAGAELFVSVHADAVRDPSVSGSSVYVLSLKGATDEQARLLADRENAADLAGGVSLDDKDPVIASVLVDLAQSAQISQSMVAAERVLRSLSRVNEVRKPLVQQAGFVVLKSPDIPSMLVETAFISSPADERLLNKPERRKDLAEAIFDGVKQFFVDHPPDGSRFAKARESGRTVVATTSDSAPARSGKL